MAISFQNLLPNRFFNCPLLPTSQNSLAGELSTTQKFLDTPLLAAISLPITTSIRIKSRNIVGQAG